MMGAADELRKAAETLRGLVNALDPWEGESAEEAGYETWADRYGVKPSYSAPDRAEQGFIATMHPGVGLALADWLDAMATVWDGGGKYVFGSTEQRALAAMDIREPDPTSLAGRAFTLARLINGGAE